MDTNTDSSLFQLNLEPDNSPALRGAASWARVLAITGIAFGILFFAIGISFKSQQSDITWSDYGTLTELKEYNQKLRMAATIRMLSCVLTGLVFIVSSIFALSFSNRIRRALRSNDQPLLAAGFAAVRNYFAFWSVLMILMLLLAVLAGLGSVA
jgi:hypothetical protein